jgi:uncharacterized protein (DUF924 family)
MPEEFASSSAWHAASNPMSRYEVFVKITRPAVRDGWHYISPMQHDILDFWFGPPPHAERDVWFRKDAAFDATIRERFGADIEAALAGGLREWTASAHGALARVIVLDQFTRNAFRDLPRAFAGDADALATSRDAIAAGFDRSLDPYERWFLYMPFQHCEDRAIQQRSVELFEQLATETGLAGPLEWARRHAAVIARFGRFPHRNAILGRESMAAEAAFLAGPGSRF